MTAKEYLQQVKRIDSLIRAKKEEIESLNDLLNVRAVNYDKVPSDVHGTDTMQKLILRKIELEDELEGKLVELLAQKREIMNTVDKLAKAEEIELIYARYFRFMKWEDIAELMGYEERQIYRLHGYALLELSRILSSQ